MKAKRRDIREIRAFFPFNIPTACDISGILPFFIKIMQVRRFKIVRLKNRKIIPAPAGSQLSGQGFPVWNPSSFKDWDLR